MPECSNTHCHRRAGFTAIYGFEEGPRLKNPLCRPCKAMLLEGDHAVDIQLEEGA